MPARFAVGRGTVIVALTPAHRDALLAVLDKSRTPARRVPLSNSKRVRVAAAVGGHTRLEHHDTAAYINNTDRMLIAVRVDTDHEVQLICNHPH